MSGPSPQAPPAPRDPVQTLMGVGSVFLGHALLVLLVMVITTAGVDAASAILVIGAAQVVYVVPLMGLSWRRGARRFFWGVMGGALVTLMLNGACWWLVVHSLEGL